jgi:hypothetical protein
MTKNSDKQHTMFLIDPSENKFIGEVEEEVSDFLFEKGICLSLLQAG